MNWRIPGGAEFFGKIPDKNHQIDFLVSAFFKMPDKKSKKHFLVMAFSEMPDRKPANVVLSGIKKTRRPTGSAQVLSGIKKTRRPTGSAQQASELSYISS